MKISENIGSLLSVYAKKAEEKAVNKAEASEKSAAAETAGKIPEAASAEKRDRYVPAEDKEAIGLYELYSDEKGALSVKFDKPESDKADEAADEKKADKNANEADKADKSKASEDGGKDKKVKSEKCTGNTDKVDREIERLKKKAEQLEMQLRSAEDGKAEEISRKLKQVESELARKDNDTYRRAHTVFS